MRKYLSLLGGIGLVLFSTSCKKDYDCECTDEDGDEFTFTLVEVTKKQAKANCISTESTDTYTDYNGNPQTFTSESDCELK